VEALAYPVKEVVRMWEGPVCYSDGGILSLPSSLMVLWWEFRKRDGWKD
jgi:hypothetical protein